MKPWSVEIWRLGLLLILALFIGSLIGHTGWAISIALAAYLLLHFRQLYRLNTWLLSGRRADVPEAGGVWGDVFYAFQRLEKSKQKRKKKLASMLSRFQESTSALPDGTIVISPYGEIEWINTAAKRLLGLSSNKDVGRRISQLIRHPDFIQYLSAGDYGLPIQIDSPIDERMRLSIHIVPYGKNQRLLVIRDVTRLHQLESMRRDFVANVSHELRTPLTVITGYLEMLGDDMLQASEDTRKTVAEMQDQTQRMRNIVEDLLLLSRLETDKTSNDDQSLVPVPALLADIQAEAKMLSPESRHQFVCEADNHLWLRGNSKELYSAFMNLVSNAVRYSPEGGEIYMRWYADEAGAHFMVEDHGVGIEPQYIPRLTERFYRVDKDRSRSSGGTGLGLAIVKHVMQRHDADLSIESELGKGSRFACHFRKERVVDRPPAVNVASA